MRCVKAKKTVSDYLDECLSRRKTTQLEAHLQKCSDCAKELEELRKLSLALQNAGRVEASKEYWGNYWSCLRPKLPPEPIPTSFTSKWTYACIELLRKPVPAIYTIIVVLLVGALVYLSDFYLDKHNARVIEKSHPKVARSIDTVKQKPSNKISLGASSKPVVASKKSFSAEFSQLEEKMARRQESERAKRQKGKKAKGLMGKRRGERGSENAMEKRNRTEALAFGEPKTTRGIHKEGIYTKPEAVDRLAGLMPMDVDKSEKFAFTAQADLKESNVELYGLIIRVLKLKRPKGAPKTPPLVVNVPKGDDLDSIFLAELRKANSKAGMDFDFILSSKAVTIADRRVSVSFRSGDLHYTLKIKPEKKGELTYSANYFKPQALLKAKSSDVHHIALPRIDETVMLKLPAPNFTPNDLIVLLTRFKP